MARSYPELHAVGSMLVSYGKVVKIAAAVIGGLIGLSTLFFAKESLTFILYGLVFAVVIGGSFYIAGIVIGAAGEALWALADIATNSWHLEPKSVPETKQNLTSRQSDPQREYGGDQPAPEPGNAPNQPLSKNLVAIDLSTVESCTAFLEANGYRVNEARPGKWDISYPNSTSVHYAYSLGEIVRFITHISSQM